MVIDVGKTMPPPGIWLGMVAKEAIKMVMTGGMVNVALFYPHYCGVICWFKVFWPPNDEIVGAFSFCLVLFGWWDHWIGSVGLQNGDVDRLKCHWMNFVRSASWFITRIPSGKLT